MHASNPALAPVLRETTSPSVLLDPIAMEGAAELATSALRPAQVSPLPACACALATGIAWAEIAAPPPSALATGALSAAALAALAALVLTTATAVTRARLTLVAALVCFVGGIWLADDARRTHLQAELRGTRDALVVARIDGPVRVARDGRRAASARIERIADARPGAVPTLQPADLAVWMLLPASDAMLARGDRIAARVVLRGPMRPLAPGGFDERELLRQRELVGVASVRGQPVPMPAAPGPIGALDRHRQRAGRLLAEHGGDTGILPALALGQGAAVDPDTREVFGRSGLAHVLAVSGLHFGLVALAVFWVARMLAGCCPPLLRTLGAARAAALVTLPVLAVYVVYVGAPVSARRAFIMAACLLGGRLIGREAHPQISLSAAALIILAVQPSALTNAGFQLSFAAVVGLLWTSRCWEQPGDAWLARRVASPWLGGALRWLWSGIVSTTGASLATTPLVIWHFGQVPLLGGLANLWVVPVVSFVLLPLGLVATLLCDPWPSAAVQVARLAAWCEHWLVESVEVFDAHMPAILVETVAQPGWVLVTYAVAGGALLLAPHWPWRAGPVAALGAVALVVWHAGLSEARRTFRDGLRVTFVSIGQGDATLIEFPDGRAMLIDGGGVPSGGFDTGARIVMPFLHRLGRDRLDWVVLTHPDFDHMGGLPSVIRATRPGEVWTNGDVLDSSQYADFEAAIAESGAEHRVVSHGFVPLDVGGATLRVLWPDRVVPGRERNDASIVIHVQLGDVSFLLPGDAETDAEREMLEQGVLDGLHTTVLKAGHHGSRSSTTQAFLDAVDPAWLVYSLGEDNKFGFPHREVYDRARRAGLRQLRTDHDGTLRMTTDGARLKIESWNP